jgi:hypothetical protein
MTASRRFSAACKARRYEATRWFEEKVPQGSKRPRSALQACKFSFFAKGFLSVRLFTFALCHLPFAF